MTGKTENITRTALRIAVLLAVVIFTAGWDRQQWLKAKCGDGICQRWEERNGSCPEDCQKNVSLKQQEAANEPSLVRSVEVIKEDGGRVDWSPKGDLIAFDRKGQDGYYDIWVMRPDGCGEKCLTRDNHDLPMHNGNPSWHASGNYILFQGVDPGLWCKAGERWTRHPGGGINNNLWLVSADGSKFWQLTKVKDRMGVLHPHFSYDGTKIAWAEKVGNEPPNWGDWVIKVADFSVQDDEPVVSNIISVKPDHLQFFETHGFSPDNTKITFSAFYPGESLRTYNAECTHLDEYIYDLREGKLQRLTDDNTEWDEFLQFSPDGKKLIWMSSRDISQRRDRQNGIIGGMAKFDYWIADSNGLNKRRLTHFNAPGYAEYMRYGAAPADYSFSPDSKKIVAKVRQLPSKFDDKERIMVIEIDTPGDKIVSGKSDQFQQ